MATIRNALRNLRMFGPPLLMRPFVRAARKRGAGSYPIDSEGGNTMAFDRMRFRNAIDAVLSRTAPRPQCWCAPDRRTTRRSSRRYRVVGTAIRDAHSPMCVVALSRFAREFA